MDWMETAIEQVRYVVEHDLYRHYTDDMGPVEFRRLVLKAIAELASRIDEVQQELNAEVVELSDIQGSDTLTTD